MNESCQLANTETMRQRTKPAPRTYRTGSVASLPPLLKSKTFSMRDGGELVQRVHLRNCGRSRKEIAPCVDLMVFAVRFKSV